MSNIPLAPGAPSVFGAIADAVTVLTGDQLDVGPPDSSSQWGLFDDSGTNVLDVDNVVAVEYAKDWRVSDYPMEQGAFQSYNKVETPAEPLVVFTVGGSEQRRAAFLTTLDALTASTEVFDVVTPEISYSNMNVVRYTYGRRADRGATLITAEVHLMQIRQTVKTTFTKEKVQSVSGASPVNNGTVQAQPDTPAPAPVT